MKIGVEIKEQSGILLFFLFSRANVLTIANHSRSIFDKAMELDGDSKRAVQELGDAINEAIEKSSRVIDALEEIRASGYEPNIGIKLQIGLMPITHENENETETAPQTELEMELTDEDLRELRKMNISLD